MEKLELDLFSGFILDFFLSFVFLFDNVSYRKEIKISFRHYVNMLLKIFKVMSFGLLGVWKVQFCSANIHIFNEMQRSDILLEFICAWFTGNLYD